MGAVGSQGSKGSMQNRLNPLRGRQFQEVAARVLGAHLGVRFTQDYAVPIGAPPKNRKFDLVSTDGRYIGECKSYSWTKAGNTPSAQMATTNEAVLYLHHVPSIPHRFIAMPRATHPKKSETLAEYYFRTYRHLLGDVAILEVDTNTGEVREFRNHP